MSDWKNVQYKDGKMRTSEGGGGGGSSTFAGLDDVSFNNLQNGQVPKYNSETQKWENANESGGGHTYSTTEQVVATWTDGKPVYERTFVTPSFSGSYDIQTGIPFGMAMIVGGYYMLNDNNSMIGLNEWFASANYSFCHAELDGDIRCHLQGYTGVGCIIVRYTKTTDV